MKSFLLTAASILGIFSFNSDNHSKFQTDDNPNFFIGDSLKNKKLGPVNPDSSIIDQLKKRGDEKITITIQSRKNVNDNMPMYTPDSTIRYYMPIVTPNRGGAKIIMPADSVNGFNYRYKEKFKPDSLLKKEPRGK